MTFPIETEAAMRRRMLDICQEHTRLAVEVSRGLALFIDSIVENRPKRLKEQYDSLLKMVEESEQLKTRSLQEVASVGSLLINREDFVRLIFGVSEIADYAEAVADRLFGVMQKKWKIDRKYLAAISELSSLVLDEMIRMRETMMSLGFNPEKAMNLSKGVEEVERKIDTRYRALELEVLERNMPIQSLLILRDILTHLEGMADIGANVVDLIRVLALSA